MPKSIKDFENEYALLGALSYVGYASQPDSLSREQMVEVRDRLNMDEVFDEAGHPRVDVLLPIVQDVMGRDLSGRSAIFEGFFNTGSDSYRERFDNGSSMLPVAFIDPQYGQALYQQEQSPIYYVSRNVLEANSPNVRAFFKENSPHKRPTASDFRENRNLWHDFSVEIDNSIEPVVDPEFSDVRTIYGWSGQYLGAGQRSEGLRDTIGGLISQEDAAIMAEIFDGHELESTDMDYMYQMIREYRNRGYDVHVNPPYEFAQKNNNVQLNVTVSGNGLRGATVRLYDDQSSNYLGRVTTESNNYYWQFKSPAGDELQRIAKEEFKPTVEESMKLFDVATGRIHSIMESTQYRKRRSEEVETASKYNDANNQVSYSSTRFHDVVTERTFSNGSHAEMEVFSTPNGNYYSNVGFNKVEKAEQFLKDQIEISEKAFVDVMKFDKLAESAELMVRAQEIERDQQFTKAQQREARQAIEAIENDLTLTYDARYSNMQARLFEDMVALERYSIDPNNVELTFDSIGDDAIRQELLDKAKAIQNGTSLDDLTISDLQDAFMQANFGSYETGFNPAIVSQLGQSAERSRLNRAVASAIKISGYDQNKLRGTDYAVNVLKDQMIQFDPVSARTLDEVIEADPEMLNHQTKALIQVQNRLDDAGFENSSVAIDEHGVIHYEYDRSGRYGTDRISNDIGQVFNEDEYGVIQTDFASGVNFGFVPGYDGFFIPGDDENMDHDTLPDRLRLRGYDQAIASAIDLTMTKQLQAPWQGGDVLNVADDMGGSALNKVYRSELTGYKVPLDYSTNTLKKDTQLWADIQTERLRVRFPNSYGESAGTNYEQNLGYDGFSEAKMIQENMRVIGNNWDNIFDKYMMGSGKNQGIERYLVEGAKVNSDMTVERSDGWVNPMTGELELDRTALTKESEFSEINHMPADRQMMATKQHLVAHHITDKVGIAMMQFGGWTYDDSYVVSKDFADKYQVPIYHDEEGRMRSLKRGDKLSDMGSNKGVISLIVDRDMDLDVARELGIEREVMFFKENPDLDVVGGPYALLSRNNMSVPRMLRQEGVSDLYNPITGEMLEGGIGYAEMMVTDMTVDKKSHGYTKNDVREGKGRSISTTLLLNLQALGAQGIMDEVYGNNMAAWSDLREYMIAYGCDMDRDGNLKVGFHPQDDEVRNHYTVNVNTDFDYNIETKADVNRLNRAISSEIEESANDFLQHISDKGGFLKLPFPLVNKELNEELLKNKDEPRFGKNGQFADRAIARDDEFDYAIPILSGALRRNTELLDGSTRISDVTNLYAQIYKRACDYKIADARIAQLERGFKDGSIAKTKELVEELNQQKKDRVHAYKYAQAAYDDVHNEIAPKLDGPGPNGKHSLIRDKITSKRVANSATLVASPDPRLKVNQIAISEDMAKTLGVSEGEKVMGWRDPTWRTGAVRSFEVVIDNDVTGFAMSPLMDKSHDGDFDGDAYGFKGFTSEAAKADLETKLSHGFNMRNLGDDCIRDDDGNPVLNKNGEKMYPIFVNDGMDVASTSAAKVEKGLPDPERLRQKAFEYANGTDDEKAQVLDVLNEYMNEALRSDESFASDYINLTNSQTVMTSLSKIVDHGAKGSPAALLECAKYDGAEVTDIQLHDGYNGKDAENAQDIDKVKEYMDIVRQGGLFPLDNPNSDKPFAGDIDRTDVQYAVGTKSDNTARPGTLLQKATAGARNKNLGYIMETFYKPIQMTLQIKHDAKEAKHINDEFDNTGKINMLMVQGIDPEHPGKDSVLSRDSFVRQVGVEFNNLGLDYTPEHLEALADALADKQGNIRSLDKMFEEDTSYFNKLSFGGQKRGGVKALVQGAATNQSLFEGEHDIDRNVVPKAMREKTQILARPDVLQREQTVLKDVDNKLRAIEGKELIGVEEPVIEQIKNPREAQYNEQIKRYKSFWETNHDTYKSPREMQREWIKVVNIFNDEYVNMKADIENCSVDDVRERTKADKAYQNHTMFDAYVTVKGGSEYTADFVDKLADENGNIDWTTVDVKSAVLNDIKGKFAKEQETSVQSTYHVSKSMEDVDYGPDL